MSCKSCKEKPVWKFTNKVQLCKNCFCDYFEKKIFAAIRKFNLMPADRIFKIKKDKDLNTNVLVQVLKSKFQVELSDKPNIKSENLSQIAENVFSEVLKGNFNKSKSKIISPLYYLSNNEIKIYANLKKIKGKSRRENKKINSLFKKFTEKNLDLEHNIVNAFNQI